MRMVGVRLESHVLRPLEGVGLTIVASVHPILSVNEMYRVALDEKKAVDGMMLVEAVVGVTECAEMDLAKRVACHGVVVRRPLVVVDVRVNTAVLF
jgi:hypothetical protein